MLFSQPYGDFRNYIANLNLNGGVMTGNSFAVGVGNLSSGIATWNVAGDTTSTISADLFMVKSQYSELDVNVASGAASTALLWSGNVIDVDPYNSAWDGMTLRKIGDGKMVMTGANAYKAASFNIDGGTVQIGDGGSTGTLLPCTVNDNATLAFNRSDTVTVNNVIGGTGSVIQQGTGTLVLTNTSYYSGATTINSGKMYVTGAISQSSPIAVNAGALFGGATTAGAATVNPGGTIEGGYNGAGTLTLTSLTYNGSGALNITPALGYVPLIVSNYYGLTVNGGSGSVGVNVVTPVLASGAYPVVQYLGDIQGTGFPAFTIGATPPGRCATYGLANNPGEIDLNVVVTPVIWTGSASTAWDATDTIGAAEELEVQRQCHEFPAERYRAIRQ